MKPGFYWVRIGEVWTIGEYYGGAGWVILGFLDDSPLDEIGVEIVRFEPEPLWKPFRNTVAVEVTPRIEPDPKA
jgi:hypothetical protein